jgi:cytochrome P450
MSESIETPLFVSTQVDKDPYSVPLETIDVADFELFETDQLWGWFKRLRDEDPVHWCVSQAEDVGGYWSITKYNDIVEVEKNPDIYSSEPSIVIVDPDPEFPLRAGFITMDGERHDRHRKTVQPVASPRNLRRLEPLIRERVGEILDNLPVGETFDWVDRVSIELTTGMLATMFDFPWEERRKLTYWSDIATMGPEQLAEIGKTEQDRIDGLKECLAYFTNLWNDRKDKPATGELDFVSALANSAATQDVAPEVSPLEYLGTLILLIVGGNDTTRNSTTGGVLALNENPSEYEKLRKDPSLIPNMVNEIIRWQTPLAHMRRTATQDTTLGGKKIKKGDKIVMWYVSGNRDDTVIPDADKFLIDRENSKQHLSFGLGAHFCMGSRLAEMQLRVVWEEVMDRFDFVEVVGEPKRVKSSFVKGYHTLPVQVHPKS